MQRVFIHASKILLEQDPSILKIIRELFGEYIIEGEVPGMNYAVVISFFTDKLSFIEGENRRVDITFRN